MLEGKLNEFLFKEMWHDQVSNPSFYYAVININVKLLVLFLQYYHKRKETCRHQYDTLLETFFEDFPLGLS